MVSIKNNSGMVFVLREEAGGLFVNGPCHLLCLLLLPHGYLANSDDLAKQAFAFSLLKNGLFRPPELH